MIKSIRMRQLQKPIITRQIIYNHRQEQLDSNSDMSFLKSSENTSKQLNQTDSDHFSRFEDHLYHLTQRSKLKINCIKSSIRCLETGKDQTYFKRDLSDLPYRQIMEQNKENPRMTYPVLVASGQDTQNMQECNFEVDQNRNYVKNMALQVRNNDQLSENKKCSKQQKFYSLQVSRKLSPRQQICHENDFGGTKRRFSEVPSQNNQQMNKLLSLTKISHNSNKKKNSLKKTNFQDYEYQKGRIYEYILSHYSIPKLLAMKPKKYEK